MFGSSLMTKGKSFAYQKYGTESQKILAQYLYDDKIHAISSFSMNKIASLTYGESVCEEMFEMIETTLSSSSDHSPLSLQKTLVLVKHVLIYGHERCIDLSLGLGYLATRLLDYNTATAPDTSTYIINTIKGGAVDAGRPVRDAAKELTDLLDSRTRIEFLRKQNECAESLVPIGDRKEIGFESEDYKLAKEKAKSMDPMAKIMRDLEKKDKDGFGGGNTIRDKDGKVIVGAGHSIEEMLEVAAKNKRQYYDAPVVTEETGSNTLDSEYTKQMMAPVSDLLDLEDYNTSGKAIISSSKDLLSGPPVDDLTDWKAIERKRREEELQKTLQQQKEDDELKTALQKQQEEIEKLKREVSTKNNTVDDVSYNLNNMSLNLSYPSSLNQQSAFAFMNNNAADTTTNTMSSSGLETLGPVSYIADSLNSSLPPPPPMAPPPPPPHDGNIFNADYGGGGSVMGMGGKIPNFDDDDNDNSNNKNNLQSASSSYYSQPSNNQKSSIMPNTMLSDNNSNSMSGGGHFPPGMGGTTSNFNNDCGANNSNNSMPSYNSNNMMMNPQQQQTVMGMQPQQMMMNPQQQMMMMQMMMNNQQQQQMMNNQMNMMPQMMNNQMNMMDPQQQQMMMMNMMNMNNPMMMNNQMGNVGNYQMNMNNQMGGGSSNYNQMGMSPQMGMNNQMGMSPQMGVNNNNNNQMGVDMQQQMRMMQMMMNNQNQG